MVCNESFFISFILHFMQMSLSITIECHISIHRYEMIVFHFIHLWTFESMLKDKFVFSYCKYSITLNFTIFLSLLITISLYDIEILYYLQIDQLYKK